MVYHNIEPIFDSQSRILILGSFPSVKSREGAFFYDHPRNRFWHVLSTVLNDSFPVTHEQKKAFLLRHNIALWDVLASCEIHASADSTIKNATPNDIRIILSEAKIERIFCNGNTSFINFNKYIAESVHRDAVKLPSTSPANAAYTIDKLCKEWQQIAAFLI